jgi:16S rRNA (guanine966-N2)-methyltransferase
MRIITGTLKGRKITIPAHVDMRPTSDRAKESIFSIIEVRRHITGCSILDLFAGSGNLGFEAISRGAEKVLFVEQSSPAIDHIQKTARQFGVEEKVRTLCSSAESFLNGPPSRFDIIFADPPYDYPEMIGLPEIILKGGWLKPDGWFILEHDKRHHFGEHPNCVFTKPYGRTIASIFLAGKSAGNQNETAEPGDGPATTGPPDPGTS